MVLSSWYSFVANLTIIKMSKAKVIFSANYFLRTTTRSAFTSFMGGAIFLCERNFDAAIKAILFLFITTSRAIALIRVFFRGLIRATFTLLPALRTTIIKNRYFSLAFWTPLYMRRAIISLKAI